MPIPKISIIATSGNRPSDISISCQTLCQLDKPFLKYSLVCTYMYVSVCMACIGMQYIPVHAHTYQYTRVPKHTRPPISAPRALIGQFYFLYALSAVGNTAPESGRPKEARLRAATRNVASLWSIGPESMKVPVGGLPVLAHGPWATRSWCQQCDTYIRGPKGTSDRLERTQRPALRSQVAKVCIITYL